MLTAPPAGSCTDPDEGQFWTLMRRFEVLALERYVAYVPDLATTEKRAFVDTVQALDVPGGMPNSPDLARASDALFAAAGRPDAVATLVVQGVILERLGQAIYGIVATREQTVGEATRVLARTGRAASASVTTLVPAHLAARVGSGDDLWAAFAGASHDVLAAVDGVAEPVDRAFGERFGLRFADVMGEFTADLVGVCTELGMPRRKVVAHLASAAMGL
jgi:hypothetical protein